MHLSSRIVPEDLLIVARKLVKSAHKRRAQVRFMHINRMKLQLAKECIALSLDDGELYYY